MSKKLKVAEGILDASEYLEINLASLVSVQAYAENGMNIYLSDDEAKKVLDVCKEHEVCKSNLSNDYYVILSQLEDE